jgi:hypothetical protein
VRCTLMPVSPSGRRVCGVGVKKTRRGSLVLVRRAPNLSRLARGRHVPGLTFCVKMFLLINFSNYKSEKDSTQNEFKI